MVLLPPFGYRVSAGFTIFEIIFLVKAVECTLLKYDSAPNCILCFSNFYTSQNLFRKLLHFQLDVFGHYF